MLITALVVVCAGAATTYALTREPTYTAHTQLFVSTRFDPGLSPSQIYQGGLASQSRAESYARIVSTPPVAEAVIEELDLNQSTEEVQDAITASVPTGTALIDISATDESPERATEIADVVAETMPDFVRQLEAAPDETAAPTEVLPETEGPVDLSVTSPAVEPTAPDSTSAAVYGVGGAIAGLVLGIGAALLRELFDRRIKDTDATETVAGAPVLAHIPYDPRARARPLVFIDDPDSMEAEAYRRLRTNLRGATTDSGRRSILVTSAVSGEGKTLITANLGLAFAQTGQKVVLVDADMRQPGLGRLFNMEETRGLADVLAGESLEDIVLRENELPLQIVTSGFPERNPAELLESSRFREVIEQLQSDNDLVIVDSPALLPVSDAAAMARACAAILIVARVSSTHAEELDIAAESLRTVGRRPIGAVLNDSSARMGPAYTYERRRVRDDARSAARASGG